MEGLFRQVSCSIASPVNGSNGRHAGCVQTTEFSAVLKNSGMRHWQLNGTECERNNVTTTANNFKGGLQTHVSL